MAFHQKGLVLRRISVSNLDAKVEAAITRSVKAAVKQMGINGLRGMSMFPSSQKRLPAFKIAA